MTVTAQPQILANIRETLTTGVDAASNNSITHNGFDLTDKVIKASGGDAPGSIPSAQTYSLVAGAKTLDLTAIEGVNGVAQDATGLKPQWVLIRNPASATTVLNVAPGAANPYPMFGAGNAIDVPPGTTLAMYVPEQLPDVAAGVKEIDFAGTGTETFDFQVILG